VSLSPAAGCLAAVRGCSPRRWWRPGQVRFPERILLIETQTKGTPFITASYHAPPGVSWKIIKPQQAVAFASWLSRQNGPLLFGADANTPLIDAPDFAKTRTHWHTGHRRMHGELGDDLLFGPDKKHDLKDALRRWLALHPDEMNQLRASKPSGPLPSPTGPGGAGTRRARTGASILLGQPPLGRGASSTYTRRA
jgi:hypothetical protein